MWSQLDLEQMAAEENFYTGVRSSAKEVEDIVVFVRLERYNRGLQCGPKALRQRLDEHYSLIPLPSERTIARIPSRNSLTHGRTGSYSEESGEINEKNSLNFL